MQQTMMQMFGQMWRLTSIVVMLPTRSISGDTTFMSGAVTPPIKLLDMPSVPQNLPIIQFQHFLLNMVVIPRVEERQVASSLKLQLCTVPT